MNIYEQLFTILKEAIFGAETVLTGTQTLSLDLICTLGSLALTLVPVLLCIGFAKRFILERW